MASKEQICDAIKNRIVLEFSYSGTQRKVEPHLLGYNQKNVLTLSAWQLEGTEKGVWRAFHLEKIEEFSATEEVFAEPRSGFNLNDKTMKQIICHV